MAEVRRRRRRLAVGVTTALGVLAWGLFVGVSLVQARSEIRRGISAVEAIRARATPTDLAGTRLIPDLQEARQRFASGSDRLQSPPMVPLRYVPFVGRQLRSVLSLSAATQQVVEVGIDGLTETDAALEAVSGERVGDRIEVLRRLGTVARRAQERLDRVTLGPRLGLLPPLARARNEFATELGSIKAGVERGAVAAPAVADLLAGPRRYLVFAANNAEMRAGSGMFLSAGELVTGPDGLRLGDLRSVTDVPVPAGSVPLEGELAQHWGWLRPNQEWRNLMTSPRFDVAAPLAVQMWVAAGNRPVDGVLALDPVAYSGLLAATGPVEVDGRRIGSAEVVDELLHAQYLRFPANETEQRRERLDRIAGAVFDALDRGRWSVPELVNGLSEAAGGRHVLLWSSRADEQAAWKALGVDGSLQGNSLSVAVLNRGGNKLDRFLQVSANLSFTAIGPDTQVTVQLELRNSTPTGQPRYVAGPAAGAGVGEGVYLGIVALSLPGAARDAHFDGVEQLAVAGGDGPTRVIGFQLQVARDEVRTVVARFLLPGHAGTLRVEPSARVPPIAWSNGSARWRDVSAKIFRWTGAAGG